MKENFKQSLAWILKHEGGKVDDPHDPGGRTNQGITQRTYDDYRRSKGLPKRDVYDMEDHERDETYRINYADMVKFDDMPSGLDYSLFDFAVHSGQAQAAKVLQRIVGALAYGVIGMRSLAAVKQYIDKHGLGSLVDTFNHARLRFIRTLRVYPRYKNGWEKRVSQVIRRANEMVEQEGYAAPPVDWADTVAHTQDMAAPATGEQTLTGSIADSKRSQGAVVGSLGVLGSVVAQVSEVAQPVQDAFAWSKYAALIGLLVAAIAFGFIIWHRSRSTG